MKYISKRMCDLIRFPSLQQGWGECFKLIAFTTSVLHSIQKKRACIISAEFCLYLFFCCQTNDRELPFDSCHRRLARGQLRRSNPCFCLEQGDSEFRTQDAILKAREVLQDKQGISMCHNILLLSYKQNKNKPKILTCFTAKHASFFLSGDMHNPTERSENL